jgi:micrococcal nuclease
VGLGIVLVGLVAVLLFIEYSQTPEKFTINIPISELPQVIKEPLKITSKTPPKVAKLELPIPDCFGTARCIKGKVTKIIDGDTIHVDDKSVRFALVSAPEIGIPGGIEARDLVEKICPVGSVVIVDEDDKQTQSSYGRILAEIHCNGVSLNEEILKARLGKISVGGCSKSEFSSELWALKFGCKV